MVEVAAVRRIPRFSGVAPEAHEWLAATFVRRFVPKGQIVFVEGEDSSTFYLVGQGCVKVFRSLESGRELIISMFRTGEAIGEVAVIDGNPYPASAVAHEDTVLLSMPRDSWMHYLKHFDGAAIALVRNRRMRMRTMQRRMEDLGGSDVEYRIAPPSPPSPARNSPGTSPPPFAARRWRSSRAGLSLPRSCPRSPSRAKVRSVSVPVGRNRGEATKWRPSANSPRCCGSCCPAWSSRGSSMG